MTSTSTQTLPPGNPFLSLGSTALGSTSSIQPQPTQDLEEELDTPLFHLLNEEKMYRKLRWAGFRSNYHTLSTIELYHRKITRVDEPGLHLMWISNPPTHFIKPLPSVLADEGLNFDCLGEKARGLLYSYTRLIHSELDFDIAISNKLLPRQLAKDDDGWELWLKLASKLRNGDDYRKQERQYGHRERWPMMRGIGQRLKAVLGVEQQGKKPDECRGYRKHIEDANEEMKKKDFEVVDKCHRRYAFGDLRLGRINWIALWAGYGYNYFATRSPRDGFFERHKKLITAYIVYAGLLLTAMQVSLQASTKPDWITRTFQYCGYVVILLTGGQVPLIAILFSSWLVVQLITFALLSSKEEKTQEREREKRKEAP